MAHIVKYLPCKPEALSSNRSAEKRKKRKKETIQSEAQVEKYF
jgi:hypothetical protein